LEHSREKRTRHRNEPPIFTAYIRCFVSGWQNSSCATATTPVKASATASFSTAATTSTTASSQHITWTYQTTAPIPFISAVNFNFAGTVDVPLAS
jgi:hypothetical protein